MNSVTRNLILITRAIAGLLACGIAMLDRPAVGQAISYTTGTYTQDFQSMSTTGGTSSFAGSTMTQVSTLASGGSVTGWYIYGQGWTTSANKWFAGTSGNGGSSTGGFYGMYSSSGGNLALGSQGSGSAFGWYGVVLQNISGSTINAASVSWDAVINRNPATTVNPTTMAWLVSGSNVTASGTNQGTFSDTAGSWTSGTTYSTPSSGTGSPGTQAAINPMFTYNSPTLGLSSMNWTNNSYLYIRWSEADNAGADATLGIDNFKLWTSAAAAQSLTWNTTSGTWNTSTANWTGGSTNVFANGDSVTFSGTGGGTITLSGSLVPASFVVSATAGTYTFSGATPGTDRISGVSLAKSGAGTAVFTTANDLTSVSITGGVVSISGSDQLGSGLITVNGGQLTSTAGSALTLANAFTTGTANGTVDTGSQNLTINGATNLNGVLTKSGNGTLSLGGVTTGAGGGVTVSAGNLALTSGVVNLGTNSSLTGNLVLNGATRLNVNNGATLSGNGQLQLAATGAAISNLSGTTGGTISAPIALNSTGISVTPGSWSGTAYTPSTFVSGLAGTGSSTIVVSGTISGNADLTISNNTATGGGGGMLVLAAANTYTGNTLINTSAPGAGLTSSLRLDANNALPTTGGVIVGTLVNLGAAVLDMNGRNQQVAYLADGANVSGASKNLTIRNFGNADSTLTISGSVTPGTAFSGVIGTGSTNKINLVKAGSNTQTLTGVNTYTGNTTISGGTLALSGAGSIGSSPSISVGTGAGLDVSGVTGGFTLANGQTLSGNGTVTGGATLGNGSTISPGTTGAGTLTTGNLVLSGGATYAFHFDNATTGAGIGWDLISSGTVTLPSSAFTVALSGAGTGFNNQNAASWKILAASALSGSYNASNFTVTDSLNKAGGSFSILDSGTDGTGLYLSFTPGQVLYWTANGSSLGGTGEWNTSGNNWASDNTAVAGSTWNSAKTAIFDGTAGTVTVAAGGVDESLGMQFNTTGYTLSGGAVNLTGSTAVVNSITIGSGTTTINSPLAGSNGFTKAGAGTLALGGDNTVAGTVSVAAGTLQTTAAERIANTANVTVGSGATLQLGGNETVGSLAGTGGVSLGTSTLTAGGNNADTTFSGVASGSGGLTKAGTGTFTLGGANTYTGATTVNGGTLVTNAANRIADTSAVVVGSGATFQIGGTETVGSLAGSGTVALGSFTLTTGSDATSTSFSGVVGGSGGLTKIGAGVQTLSGQNTYSGATTISAGTLATSANDVIADTSAVSVAAGATFQVGGNDTIAALTGLGTATVGSGNTLTVSPAATGTFAGTLAGAGTLAKTGVSTLALTGTANTISNLTVAAGALSLGNTGALPTSGAVTINDAAKITLAVGGTYGGSGQTVTLAANQSATPLIDITSGSSVTLLSNVSLAGSAANRVEANGATGSLTLAGNVTGSGSLLKQAGGNLILSGSNSGTWGTQVGNGTLTVNAGSGLGSGDLAMNQTSTNNATLALNESVSVGNLSSSYGGASGNNTISIASGKTLTVTQTVNGTFGAAGTGSQSSSISGSGGFTKAGSATLTLAGANTFTGPTNVSAGTLATTVANAVSANTTVADGATLALGGAQTFTSLSAAGTVAAGSSAVTVNNASANTVAALTGAAGASLTKQGAGDLSITDGSGYAGSMTISSGNVTAGGLGSGAVTMTAGSLIGTAGSTIASSFTIGTAGGGITSAPFSGYWNFTNGAAVATVTGSGVTFGDVTQNNNNGTTTMIGNTSPSSGYTLAYGGTASGGNNAGLAAIVGALSGTSGYFGFTVSGSSFIVNSVQLGSRGTGTGPQALVLQSGTEANGNTLFAVPLTSNTTAVSNNSTWAGFNLQPSGTTASGLVYYRLYGVNGAGSAGANTANWRIDDLYVSGSAFTGSVQSGSGTLGINQAGSVTYSGNIVNNNLATLTAAASGTATFSGAISGAGSITKTGLGTVILSGNSTYGGATTVAAGTLVANGSLSSAVSVAAGATLGGSGSVGALSGAGQIGPGNSPGILTATSFDGSLGLGAAFEITGTAPVYNTASASVNDVLRLTSVSPFAASLTSGNVIDVYFDSVAEGTYDAGFFTTLSAQDLLTAVQTANWRFWGKDVSGTQSYNGSNYKNLLSFAGITSASVTTVARTVDFGGGSVSGSITQFVVVPEPSSLALTGLGIAFGGYAALRRRRRAA